jgi:hypothetical protein
MTAALALAAFGRGADMVRPLAARWQGRAPGDPRIAAGPAGRLDAGLGAAGPAGISRA